MMADPGAFRPACFQGAGCVFFLQGQGRKLPLCQWTGLKFERMEDCPYTCRGFIADTMENRAVFGTAEAER